MIYINTKQHRGYVMITGYRLLVTLSSPWSEIANYCSTILNYTVGIIINHHWLNKTIWNQHFIFFFSIIHFFNSTINLLTMFFYYSQRVFRDYVGIKKLIRLHNKIISVFDITNQMKVLVETVWAYFTTETTLMLKQHFM